MAHIEAHDNNYMDGGLLGKDFVNSFLVFMETDHRGAIGTEQSQFYIAIRAIINKKPFALNCYKDFIASSSFLYWPKYEDFINIINEACWKNSFIEKSHMFCYLLWGRMHH